MDGAGTLSDRWALAAGRASNKGCRICHGPRLPGARLCAPCKAALKRARQETISYLIPQPSRAAEEARAQAHRRQRTAATATQPAKASRGRWPLAVFILASAAAVLAGYVALRPARPPAASAAAAPVPSPAPPRKLTVPGTQSAADAARETTRFANVPATRVAPTPMPVRAPARPEQKRAVEPQGPTTPTVAAALAAATESPAPEPAPAPVATPVVKEAPPPDRWQVMADAIGRCGRDGFFAGVVCEERARLQYCEGYWGQVPQCPSGINNDYRR